MARTMTRQINGQPVPTAPIIPVKTEAQLLAEVDRERSLQAEIERLKAENQALKTKPVTGLTLRISEKGALSVYGLGRFPYTLYREQWEKLFTIIDDIKAFIQANDSKLSRKG